MKVAVIGCDLTDAAASERAVAEATAALGEPDILVNIAGGSGPIGKTGAETTADGFDEIVTLNVQGPFNMIRAVAPAMIRTVRAANLHSRGKITPFEGTELQGVPVRTLVRGRFVQRDRQLVAGMAGWGRQVTGIQKMPAPAPRNAERSLAAEIARA